MAGIVDPDIGVITSVGRAHLEGVGSIEGVAREKASLLTSMRDGTVRIAPAPCAVLDPFVDALAGLVRVGTSDADVTVEIVDAAATGVRFAISGIAEPLHVPLLGEHNGNNAAMAAVVGRRCGLTDAAIRAGLKAVENEPMRLQAEPVAGVLLLNDAYNANPESMRAGLRVLADVAGGRRRVAVLGTMHELGAESDELHRDIGAFAREYRLADVVIAVEGSASQIAAGFGEGASVVSDSTDDAMATIAGMIQPNDAVLLKGSRRVGLERIAQHLRAGAPA
ncbi:MAG: Mur ligase family protein [Planctomycetota bacterium]